MRWPAIWVSHPPAARGVKAGAERHARMHRGREHARALLLQWALCRCMASCGLLISNMLLRYPPQRPAVSTLPQPQWLLRACCWLAALGTTMHMGRLLKGNAQLKPAGPAAAQETRIMVLAADRGGWPTGLPPAVTCLRP